MAGVEEERQEEPDRDGELETVMFRNRELRDQATRLRRRQSVIDIAAFITRPVHLLIGGISTFLIGGVALIIDADRFDIAENERLHEIAEACIPDGDNDRCREALTAISSPIFGFESGPYSIQRGGDYSFATVQSATAADDDTFSFTASVCRAFDYNISRPYGDESVTLSSSSHQNCALLAGGESFSEGQTVSACFAESASGECVDRQEYTIRREGQESGLGHIQSTILEDGTVAAVRCKTAFIGLYEQSDSDNPIWRNTLELCS